MPPWIFNIPGVHILKEKIDFFRNRNALTIEFPDWKQRAITVDIRNRSTHLAENVRVFLTVEDSEFNIGTKNVEIQMEVLSGKIANPFKSHLEPSKIDRESVCFAERDLQGRNLQSTTIPPKAKRTADLMQVDLHRGYLDVASELGFSTNGGQSRSFLMPQRCYVGIVSVESNSSSPRDFPVLFRPYEEAMPLQEFSGYNFYRQLREADIFFGPHQWEELSAIANNCASARKLLLSRPSNDESDFSVYRAREIVCLAVIHHTGAGERIKSLLEALALGEIPFAKIQELSEIYETLVSFDKNWNEFNPTFERSQSRKLINEEIIEHLLQANWSEPVVSALGAVKQRIFYGGD